MKLGAMLPPLKSAAAPFKAPHSDTWLDRSSSSHPVVAEKRASRSGEHTMAKSSNPFERPSVILMLVVAGIALFANSAVDRTDDGLPWEVTLAGFCVFAVIFSAIYANKIELALGIVSIIGVLIPTYFVSNYEVPCKNWDFGSKYSLNTDKGTMLQGIWTDAPNASKFDRMLGLDALGLSVFMLSAFNPAVSLLANTTEIYHSGLKLDDPLTGERTHDYLLLSSPRKVKDKVTGVMLLARVPTRFEVWPKEVEDYSFDLQTASNVVAPPTLTGEFMKLDKGPAIESIKKKHHLRPFLLDVYRVDYNFN